MLEDTLLQYGILGLWTATLLIERVTWQKEIKRLLNDLTIIIKAKNK